MSWHSPPYILIFHEYLFGGPRQAGTVDPQIKSPLLTYLLLLCFALRGLAHTGDGPELRSLLSFSMRWIRHLLRILDRLFLFNAIMNHRRKRHEEEMFSQIDVGLGYKISTYYVKNPKDELSLLCDLYASDKGESKVDAHPYPWASHSYTDYYSRIFYQTRTNIKRVFECGIGTNNPNFPSTMGISGKPGASLRVWRDYFPNAVIYGADIDREILFEEDRIKTFYLDQLNAESILDFWHQIGIKDFDLILDDGLHTFAAGSTLFINSVDSLSLYGIYIIEDVSISDLLKYKAFFEGFSYIVDYITLARPGLDLGDNNLVVIRKSI